MVAPEDGSYCVLLSLGPLAISSPRVDVHEDRDMSNDLVFAGGNLTHPYRKLEFFKVGQGAKLNSSTA